MAPPVGGGPISLFWAEPDWTQRKKVRSTGTHVQILSPGLSPGRGPGNPSGRVHKSFFLFNIIEVFEPHFIWSLT